LFQDTFLAPGNPDPANLGFNLANRQSGHLVSTEGTIGYARSGAVQVGNPSVGHDGGNVLAAGAFGAAALNRNFNGPLAQGGLVIEAGLIPLLDGVDPSSGEWAALSLGIGPVNTTVAVNSSSQHFGILLRRNGRLQAFDGATNLTPVEPVWGETSGHRLEPILILLSDPGDRNPFDGVGQTDVAVFHEGRRVFFFSKGNGGYANNFINFSGSSLAACDNLRVTSLAQFAAWATTQALPDADQDPWDDPDGDGNSSYAEWLAGTLAADAGSSLRILAVTPVPAGISLQFNSVAGLQYRVAYRDTALTDPSGLWIQATGAPLDGTGGAVNWVDDGTQTTPAPTPPAATNRRYRVGLVHAGP